MSVHSSLADGKGQSLVFSLYEALDRDGYGKPEPDFLKWMENTIFVDINIAGDEAAYDKHPSGVREAWQLFAAALKATSELMELHQKDLPRFQRVAEELSFLPCFLSRHPDTARFNRTLLDTSQLGKRTVAAAGQALGRHLARQSWPVRYAYAIIETIELTLDTYTERLPEWGEVYGYGVKHPIPIAQYEAAMLRLNWSEERRRQERPNYLGRYEILPGWTRGLSKLRRPFNRRHVMDYWRKGKEMMLEELPGFHLRPEWKEYHARRYRNGAKAGVIQHAIFKDILAAMKTITGPHQGK